MYRIDRESRVKKDEDWITHRSAGWRGSKETEEPEPRGVVNRRTDRGSSWSTVDSVPRVPRSSGLEEGGRCSRMETLPPSTRALHARINFLFLSLFFSLFLPLSLSFSLYDVPFDVQPLSNTPNLRLFLARNPVSQGTRRAGRQWETVRLSWRATGSRGDSWFVRSRLSSAILGFARPTLSHPALSRSRDEAAVPLLARSLYLRPATGLSAAREYPVPWGEGRLREVPTAAQAAHQGTTTSPTFLLLFPSVRVSVWSGYNSSLVASFSEHRPSIQPRPPPFRVLLRVQSQPPYGIVRYPVLTRSSHRAQHRASTLEQREDRHSLPRNTLSPCHRRELNNRARRSRRRLTSI